MSMQHLVRLRATVVDTETVEEQGKRWREKSLASAKALQEKAGLARKKEEERVAQLKRERGEEWLPSIAAQIAKEAAKEPKVPKVDPATLSEADGANSEVPQKKKKKRKSKASRKQLGVVVDWQCPNIYLMLEVVEDGLPKLLISCKRIVFSILHEDLKSSACCVDKGTPSHGISLEAVNHFCNCVIASTYVSSIFGVMVGRFWWICWYYIVIFQSL